jgi:hypothetical protein
MLRIRCFIFFDTHTGVEAKKGLGIGNQTYVERSEGQVRLVVIAVRAVLAV